MKKNIVKCFTLMSLSVSAQAKNTKAIGTCLIYDTKISTHNLYQSFSPDLDNSPTVKSILAVYDSEIPSPYESIARTKLAIMRSLSKPIGQGSYIKDFRKNKPLTGDVNVRCYAYLLQYCDLTASKPLFSYIEPETIQCAEAPDTKVSPVFLTQPKGDLLPKAYEVKNILKMIEDIQKVIQTNLSKIPWHVYAAIIGILAGLIAWKAGLLVTTGPGALEPVSAYIAIAAVIALLAPYMDSTFRKNYQSQIQASVDFIHYEETESELKLTAKNPLDGKVIFKVTVDQYYRWRFDAGDAHLNGEIDKDTLQNSSTGDRP